MKFLSFIGMMAIAVAVWGQETAPIRLQLDTHGLTDRLLQPITPQLPVPATTLEQNPDMLQPMRLDWQTAGMSDTLRAYDYGTSVDYATAFPNRHEYNFVMNPYSRNWSSSGVIATVGSGYLAGTGSFTAMPALGNVGEATMSFTQPVGDRLVLTAGLAGSKYHFGRDVWNSYGVYGRASFQLSERLSLSAFGQYYTDRRPGQVAALPYMGDTRYGGTLGIKMSERVSLDVGAQRYYDPYTRQWRTVPIIAPTVNVMGQPISVDVGGLVSQILDVLMGRKQDYSGYGGMPDMTGLPLPAGFNPNSPVRIPDALR